MIKKIDSKFLQITIYLSSILVVVFVTFEIIPIYEWKKITDKDFEHISLVNDSNVLWASGWLTSETYYYELDNNNKEQIVTLEKEYKIFSMCSSDNRVWIGASNEFLFYDSENDSWEIDERLDDLRMCKRLGQLLVFWSGNQVAILDGDNISRTTLDFDSGSSIEDVFIDSTSSLWIITKQLDLYNFHDVDNYEFIVRLPDEFNKNKNTIEYINGDIWFGGDMLKQVQLENIDDREIFNYKNVNYIVSNIFSDEAGNIWVVTGGEIWVYSNGEFDKIHLPHKFGWIENGIINSDLNIIYIATYNGVYYKELTYK